MNFKSRNSNRILHHLFYGLRYQLQHLLFLLLHCLWKFRHWKMISIHLWRFKNNLHLWFLPCYGWKCCWNDNITIYICLRHQNLRKRFAILESFIVFILESNTIVFNTATLLFLWAAVITKGTSRKVIHLNHTRRIAYKGLILITFMIKWFEHVFISLSTSTINLMLNLKLRQFTIAFKISNISILIFHLNPTQLRI